MLYLRGRSILDESRGEVDGLAELVRHLLDSLVHHSQLELLLRVRSLNFLREKLQGEDISEREPRLI